MKTAIHFTVVAILVAAGCAYGDSAGLTVASKDCVQVSVTPDQGPPVFDTVCDPSQILPLPAGGMALEIQDTLPGTQFEGRIYLDPDEIWTVPGHDIPAFDPQTAGEAVVDATAHENGAYAPARIEVWRQGNHVLTTNSGTPFVLPSDTYDITLWLDEVLDRPHQTFRVRVVGDQDVSVEAEFETGILEVRVDREGEPAAGMAEVLRHGQRLGTLGSRVPRRLSAGTYDVAVHYRTETRLYEDVHIAPTQRRALVVRF